MLKGRFSSSALPGSTEAEAAKKEAKDSNDDIAHVMGGGDLTTSAGGLLTMDATVRKKKSIVFTNDSDKGKSLKGNNHRRSVAVTNSGSSGMNSSVGSDDKKKLKKRASLSLNKNVPTESGGHGIRLAALVQANTGKDGNSGDDDEENLNFRNTDDDRYTDRPTHLNTSRGRTSGLNDTGPRLKSVRSLSSVTQAMIAKSEAQGLSEKQFAMRVNKVRSLIQKHHSLANYGFFSDNNLCSSYNFKTLKSGPSDSNKRPQQEEGMEDGDRNKEDDPLKSTFENIWQDYFARYDDDVRIFDTKLESCDKEVAEATDTLSRFVDRLDVFQSDDKSREDRAVTNFLKKQNGDIEKTLEQIDDVLEIFACPSKCDAKIREGPTGNAIDYFTTIDKLIEARQFLEDHPNYVNSSETIMQIDELQGVAKDLCEKYFSSLLKRCSVVINLKNFKQYKEESLRNMDSPSVETMKVIIQRLNKMGTKSCAVDYGTIRGRFITESLKKLNPSKFESYNMAPQKMAAYTRGKHPLIGFIHITANILAYEREIAEDILGSLFLDGWSGVAQQVIELLNKTFVNVTKKVREGGSIYGLLMMLDVDNELNETLPQITNAIKMSNDGRNPLGIDLTNSKGKVDSELGKWIGEFETILTGETAAPLSVALKVLEVQQEKSSHKPSFIPPDGTVHELVASGMNFLKKMMDYTNCLDRILVISFLNHLDKHNKDYTPLGNFFLNCVVILKENLESRVEKEKNISLKSIFLINNYNFILKSIKSLEIQDELGLAYKEIGKILDELLKTQKTNLKKTWKAAATACTVEDSVEKQTTKKTYIKEKFREFNEEVINEFNIQKTYTVPDKELQNELRILVSSYVVPKYVKFYERYKDVPFTSNITKYIKYNPETLGQMLYTLYDSVLK